MKKNNKNYKNSDKIRLFSEFFSTDIDSAYKITSKAPKRLLFSESTEYTQSISKNNEITNIINDQQIKLLVEDFISYFNHYSIKNMNTVNIDIDKFVPTYKKRYRYKKKHLNKFFRYVKKGLNNSACEIAKKHNEKPDKIEEAVNTYKAILVNKYLKR